MAKLNEAKKRGRPDKIKDTLFEEPIASLYDKHPDWTDECIESELKCLFPEAAKNGDLPSSYKLGEYRRAVLEANAPKLEKGDKVWHLGTLEENSIYPEAIPPLAVSQYQWEYLLSKPFSIREAKWWGRLYLFGATLKFHKPLLDEIEENPLFKDVYRNLYIATWAGIYAKRERISILTGNKEPDYSDLDRCLATTDYGGLAEICFKKDIETFLKFTPKGNKHHQREVLESFQDGMGIEAIRQLEIVYLGVSLGEPNISENALTIYHEMLLAIRLSEKHNEMLLDAKLYVHPRISFLVSLRKWAEENSEVTDRELIAKKAFELLEETKKESEAK